MRQRALGLLGAVVTAVACTAGTPAPGVPRASTPSPPVAHSPAPSPTPSAVPTTAAADYYIESLRARSYPGGRLELGDRLLRGNGFTKYAMSWPSGGQAMTGTISVPDGDGPFPVVVVNHGYIPASRYWVGQDSGIFGDPLAAHGFVSVAPNWPGYAGSGPAPPGLPAIVGELVASLDLISSLRTFERADATRIALIGHSNGGGISLLAMVVEPRIRAVVLFAPVSSDMADSARKWWQRSGSMGEAGSPDENVDGYRHLSPRNYFAAGQPPVLFLQGTADEDIPAAWTEATIAALRAAGVVTDAVWFPGAHHDMVGADLERANRLSEDWIRAHL